jgi:hypothetical protein
MKTLQTVDRFFFIHDPQVDRIVTRCCVEELTREHVNRVNRVIK